MTFESGMFTCVISLKALQYIHSMRDSTWENEAKRGREQESCVGSPGFQTQLCLLLDV